MFAWQSVLSACHTLGMKVAFVLRRVNGRTKIYFGGVPAGGGNVCNVLRQCVAVHLPGAVLQEQRTGFSMAEELDGVGVCSGMVTGIPSLQVSGERSWLQTLDKLAAASPPGEAQKNYALVVIADPAKDAEISPASAKAAGDQKRDSHDGLLQRIAGQAGGEKQRNLPEPALGPWRWCWAWHRRRRRFRCSRATRWAISA